MIQEALANVMQSCSVTDDDKRLAQHCAATAMDDNRGAYVEALFQGVVEDSSWEVNLFM